ncbi:MAG: hypothetical protein ABIR59_10915 [Gemmatimonadales bacterium]
MTARHVDRAMVGAAPDGVTAEAAVDGVVAAWRTMFDVLAPVIGEGGVTALFLRTCNLTRLEHDWVCRPDTGDGTTAGLALLAEVLEGRSVEEICAATHRMLTTFVTILGSLIGSALTERLLVMAWPEVAIDVCEENAKS